MAQDSPFKLVGKVTGAGGRMKTTNEEDTRHGRCFASGKETLTRRDKRMLVVCDGATDPQSPRLDVCLLLFAHQLCKTRSFYWVLSRQNCMLNSVTACYRSLLVESVLYTSGVLDTKYVDCCRDRIV